MQDILDNNEILYRCHGNANVVFAIKHNKIIRAPILHGYKLKNNTFGDRINLFIKYADLFRKFITSANIPKLQERNLSNEIHDYLNRNIADHINSSSTSTISNCSQTALCICNKCSENQKMFIEHFIGTNVFICDDATKLKIHFCTNNNPSTSTKTYSIEIKPKQGWKIQEYPTISKLIDMKNSSLCRYNAMQYTKLKNRKISKLNDYCPLDLFSGDIFRMYKAINSLIRNPQNNFRFFIDSDLKSGNDEENSLEDIIRDEFNGNVDLLIHIITKCLTRTRSKKIHCINRKETITENCNPNAILDKDCILDQILYLQRFAAMHTSFMKCDIGLKQKTYSYLRDMVENGFDKCLDDLNPMEKYIIGATMLDCSLMITFKIVERIRISNDVPAINQIIINDKEAVIFEINLFDLDPKPDNHFAKYLKVTNEAYTDAKFYSNS